MQDAPQLILQIYILARRPPHTTEKDYIITGNYSLHILLLFLKKSNRPR
jgi:hypothetical protein